MPFYTVSTSERQRMTDERTGYKRDASDRKLDKSAEVANESGQTSDTQHSSGAQHDPAEIRKHDDEGKDRLSKAASSMTTPRRTARRRGWRGISIVTTTRSMTSRAQARGLALSERADFGGHHSVWFGRWPKRVMPS